MNIEAYNLDTLRKIIRKLLHENLRLKKRLKEADIAFDSDEIFEDRVETREEYDEDQGSRIIRPYITEEMVRRYFTMFWGRMDVYAKRGRKGGYFPQCRNRWNNSVCPKQHGQKQYCDECEYRDWEPLEPRTIMLHLLGYKEDGSDVIGVYPLFPNGTCRFLVFDFDNHQKGSEETDFANVDKGWHDEVDALRRICEISGIKPLVERSRSGRGAHVWIFFNQPIPASLARNFGFMMLDRGASSINLKSFNYYDRMYPSQDIANSLGNLIALPLQGRALYNGNSAFVDENWNAYPNQWDQLLNHTQRLSKEDIENYMKKWQTEMGDTISDPDQVRPKPWRKNDRFRKDDVVGDLHLSLANGIYVDTLNLMPRIQNQIRSMAAFDNPVYYKNKRLGYSNYYNFSSVYLGKDIDGYIRIPRGLLEELKKKCETAGIKYDISDERDKGRPLRVSFKGDLRMQQTLAAHDLLSYDNGILSAATAFGKTVVCSYLIAERKVNTLILVQNKELLNQWVNELDRFLDIDEVPPTYTTKTGRIKKRDSVIGVLHGSKKALTGIVDIAMIGSLYNKDGQSDVIDSYGMVIMDECHHAAATQSVSILEKVNARYVYGVSATPKRNDDLEKINYMLIGPIRHSFTAKERALEQGIGHYVYPRFTRVRNIIYDGDINRVYGEISKNTDRNEQIVADVINCISEGRTPVILTRFKSHAEYFYEKIKESADHVFLLYGGNSDKVNADSIERMKAVPRNESIILIATDKKIGEGFNYPRLDTLILASPVSAPNLVEQYAGRLNRDYEGKKDVIVYDYVDSHIGVLSNMYTKRLKTYKKIGYQVISNTIKQKQLPNHIYDSGNYMDVFERDIVEAERKIVVSSPELDQDKVKRFLYLIKPRQEYGVEVTVITTEPDNIKYSSSGFIEEMIDMMKSRGVSVIVKEDVSEHFAVFDDELVWHGGVNLLGKEDVWDNLMRIRSSSAAAELIQFI